MENNYDHLNISEERMIKNFGEGMTDFVKSHPNVLMCQFEFNKKDYFVGYKIDDNLFYTASIFPDEMSEWDSAKNEIKEICCCFYLQNDISKYNGMKEIREQYDIWIKYYQAKKEQITPGYIEKTNWMLFGK